jgi:hypothetical protein
MRALSLSLNSGSDHKADYVIIHVYLLRLSAAPCFHWTWSHDVFWPIKERSEAETVCGLPWSFVLSLPLWLTMSWTDRGCSTNPGPERKTMWAANQQWTCTVWKKQKNKKPLICYWNQT